MKGLGVEGLTGHFPAELRREGIGQQPGIGDELAFQVGQPHPADLPRQV